jgi:hypothetical protein
LRDLLGTLMFMSEASDFSSATFMMVAFRFGVTYMHHATR